MSTIYNYKAPWTVYGLHWSQRPNAFRLGLTSFIEEYANKIQIIQLFDRAAEFVKVGEIEHNYPVTKLLWSPYKGGQSPDLFATTGDYFRIYELMDSEDARSVATENAEMGARKHINQAIHCRATLSNNKKDYCAPLTSFDWNETDPSLCVTSSIDTTCTVWDVNAQQAKTQLIAHDKEVYDVAFARGTDVFASVGADGSVRMFDLRALDHSTIIYETPSMVVPAPPPMNVPGAGPTGNLSAPTNMTVENPPLLRLAWNKQDPNYLASIQIDSPSVLILDIRVPAVPVTELQGHNANVNAIQWAPHSSGHICSAGDDSQALVWDITHLPKSRPLRDPILAYHAESSINQLSWSTTSPEWVAIAFGQSIQALKV
ncbi:ddb1 and cul4 associated factor 7 [Irineochytrium annulatum]|nr:ddb1 and cul4 associated factor 7 [Irineochytrium annulatum]